MPVIFGRRITYMYELALSIDDQLIEVEIVSAPISQRLVIGQTKTVDLKIGRLACQMLATITTTHNLIKFGAAVTASDTHRHTHVLSDRIQHMTNQLHNISPYLVSIVQRWTVFDATGRGDIRSEKFVEIEIFHDCKSLIVDNKT